MPGPLQSYLAFTCGYFKEELHYDDSDGPWIALLRMEKTNTYTHICMYMRIVLGSWTWLGAARRLERLAGTWTWLVKSPSAPSTRRTPIWFVVQGAHITFRAHVYTSSSSQRSRIYSERTTFSACLHVVVLSFHTTSIFDKKEPMSLIPVPSLSPQKAINDVLFSPLSCVPAPLYYSPNAHS